MQRWVLLFILLLFPLVSAADDTPLQEWADEKGDIWDTTPRSAYKSYLFRATHNADWLRNEEITALRATVGSISSREFLIHEEGRIVAHASAQIKLRYRFKRYDDFTNHLFDTFADMEYRFNSGPTIGLITGVYHRKEDMTLGLSFGYRKGLFKFVRFYYFAYNWLYNDKSYDDASYEKLPHRLSMEVRYPLGADYMIYLDGEMEAPWKQKFDNPDLEWPEERFGDMKNVALRLERRTEYTYTGGVLNYGHSYKADHFTYDIWRREQNTFGFKVYYAQRFPMWQWEADLPFDYTWENKHNVDPILGRRSRVREMTEIFPQISVRRMFGYMPFGEVSVMTLMREIEQNGALEGNKRQSDLNIRFGLATGLKFRGGTFSHFDYRWPIPEGELRFRVMQNLDRSWNSSFGGGNVVLILSW